MDDHDGLGGGDEAPGFGVDFSKGGGVKGAKKEMAKMTKAHAKGLASLKKESAKEIGQKDKEIAKLKKDSAKDVAKKGKEIASLLKGNAKKDAMIAKLKKKPGRAELAALEEETTKQAETIAKLKADAARLAALEEETAKQAETIAKHKADAKRLAALEKENAKLKKKPVGGGKAGKADAARLAALEKEMAKQAETIASLKAAATANAAVALTLNEKARQAEEREALRVKMVDALLPVPDHVRVFLDDKQDEDGDADKMRAQAVEPTKWLIEALKYGYLDKDIQAAAESLLIKVRFTPRLHFLQQWDVLQKGLEDALHGYAGDMKKLYDDNKLGESLSDEVVGAILGAPTGTASQLGAMAFLKACIRDDPLGRWMGERVALHAMILVAIAIDPLFQEKTRKIAGKFLYDESGFESGPVKTFPRPLNKAFSDYADKPMPRVAHNGDLLRNIVAPPTAAGSLAFLAAMTEAYGSFAKCKNVFGMDEETRASRFHLCSINLTVLFDSGRTYEDICNDPEVQAKWAEYRSKPHMGQSTEQWESAIDAAMKLLAEQGTARVKMLCETQVLLFQYIDLREMIHDIYLAWRAATAAQLYADAVQSTGTYVPEPPQRTVWFAAANGQPGRVRKLLDAGGDVNDADSADKTALYVAAEHNQVDVIHLLLERGAAVDAADNTGNTPLYIASQFGHLDAATMLLDAGANVDAANNNGATPLYIASEHGHILVAELLLGRGANVDAAEKMGRTALFIASQKGHLNLVTMLLDRGANVNVLMTNNGTSGLFQAAQEGRINVVQKLIEHKADVNCRSTASGNTVLVAATKKGHDEVAALLRAAGAK